MEESREQTSLKTFHNLCENLIEPGELRRSYVGRVAGRTPSVLVWAFRSALFVSWRPLRATWVPLGSLVGSLGATWGLVGHLGECLGGLWGDLGASWDLLEQLGCLLGVSWSLLGRLGCLLGVSWGSLGSTWGFLGVPNREKEAASAYQCAHGAYQCAHEALGLKDLYP